MLIKALVHILATAATLFFIQEYVPGIEVASFSTAVIVALVWGIIGLTIRPVLMVLTLPITVITFGLFSFVLNALLFWLLSFIDGFSVAGFVPALLGSAALTIVAWILHRLF